MNGNGTDAYRGAGASSVRAFAEGTTAGGWLATVALYAALRYDSPVAQFVLGFVLVALPVILAGFAILRLLSAALAPNPEDDR